MTVDPAGNFMVSGSYAGALAWQSDGRSGRCGIDLDFSASGNQSSDSGSVSMSGTICGQSISFSAST